MQCPIGHPPGPQEFCPICGRTCTPVEPPAVAEPPPTAGDAPTTSWEIRSAPPPPPPLSSPPSEPRSPFDLNAPVEGEAPPPLTPPAPFGGGQPSSGSPGPSQPPGPPEPAAPPSPFAPAPPFGGLPVESGGRAEDTPGGAAAKARDLIAELSGGQPSAGPSIPSQSSSGGPLSGGPLPPAPPGAPATPYLPSGPAVPSFGDPHRSEPDVPSPIPSYAPTDPAALGFPSAEPTELLPWESDLEPASPGQWSDGSAPPPPGRPRRARGGSDGEDLLDDGRGEGGARRLPVILLLLAVLLGGAYLVKTQLLDSDDDGTSTITQVRPSATATATATAPRTLSAEELAASLKDPHFKHGYDWAKDNGAVPAADREQTCRTQAFTERAGGYPWGAHDRAGCLIGLGG